MKAIVWTAYGSPEVLQLQEVPKPVPKENEVLIRIAAATVGAWDCEMRKLKFSLPLRLAMRLYVGLRRPTRVTILGQELSGEIEAAGKDVTLFKAGDQVFAATGFGMGGHAEFVCLSADGALAPKPANMSFEQAAAIPVGGLEALHFLRRANIRSGESVLINGAGGSIGTQAVQLARHFGAEVTAVDSGAKFAMLKDIGAAHLIDYTKEDFTQNGERYDVIMDVIGKSPYAASVRSLKENGRYLLANPALSAMLRAPFTSLRGSKKVISGAADQTREDLLTLKQLIEDGQLHSVIDCRYPLEQVPDAHRYVETGAKQGSVVIAITPNSAT